MLHGDRFMAFVTFENAGKIYRTGDVEVQALRDVSFEIEKGEICVVVGQSGAGKTTLLNILGGMDTLTSGKVLLDGRDISHLNEKPLDNYRVMEDVGLEDRMDNFPAQLSGGEQQRVAIARALAKNPKLLLCDEPTGALDYETGKAILKLLQDTCRKSGMTIVIITHNSALTAMADRVVRIKNGTVASVHINDEPEPVEDIEW